MVRTCRFYIYYYYYCIIEISIFLGRERVIWQVSSFLLLLDHYTSLGMSLCFQYLKLPIFVGPSSQLACVRYTQALTNLQLTHYNGPIFTTCSSRCTLNHTHSITISHSDQKIWKKKKKNRITISPNSHFRE